MGTPTTIQCVSHADGHGNYSHTVWVGTGTNPNNPRALRNARFVDVFKQKPTEAQLQAIAEREGITGPLGRIS